MINSKYNLIQSKEKYKTTPDKNSLKALLDVINERKEGSNVIQDFMKTDIYNVINAFANS